LATPPVKIRDFDHLPLHRGGFRVFASFAERINKGVFLWLENLKAPRKRKERNGRGS
jgi:hypothetical protein